MPLNIDQLRESIALALGVDENNPDRSAEDVASDLAQAIDAFVRSGDVVGVSTSVSVSVSTTGTATAQTGTGTGTGAQTGTGRIE